MQSISDHDRERLRELAKKQADMAHSPRMEALKALWQKHNDCQRVRPMVTIELGTFRGEMIDPLLRCEGEAARALESTLLSNTFNAEHFYDDTVILDYIPVSTGGWLRLFDHVAERVTARDARGRSTSGYQYIYLVEDLEEDYDKIKPSVWGCDREGARRRVDEINQIIGDILPARLDGSSLYSVPTQTIVALMGMENMCLAACDCPELLKKLMDRVADDTLSYHRYLESEGLIMPTVGFQWLGQGTYCRTDRLPGESEAARRPLTTRDVWGFLDSQESVILSPEMYRELIFPCYRRIAADYGALSYGCCEPVDKIWDSCLSTLPNLRRVSISAWCDEPAMGERLRGRDVIYHRKPSANFLGVDRVLNEDAARAHIRHTVQCSRGCELEITQRDVYTVHNDPEKVRRYVEIIREETEKHVD